MQTVSRNQNGEVDLGSDMDFERRWWRLERVVWTVMAVLVLAGVAGAFGRGPLSNATAQSPDGRVRVRYQRFGRFNNAATVEVRLSEEAVRSGHARLRLGGDFLGKLRITRVVPRPVATEPLEHGAVLTFRTDESGDGARVELMEEPQSAGVLNGEVGLEGEEPARFWEFVYP